MFKEGGSYFDRIHKNDKAETAAHMLCSSDSDVLSIMNYVGYRDSKYFYNEFKKRYGLRRVQKKFSV